MADSSNSLRVDSGQLFISDMRLGPSEDGCLLEVAPGKYLIDIHDVDDNGKRYRILRDGESVTSVGEVIKIPTEMGLLGCFDKKSFSDEFVNSQSLFEWGDEQIKPSSIKDMFSILSPQGSSIVCLPASFDENDSEVSFLYSKNGLVGCDIRITNYVDEDRQLGDTDDFFKFDFYFGSICLGVYVSTMYDEESIVEELEDVVNDFLVDDTVTRINQIMEKDELEIGKDLELSQLDSNLRVLESVNVFSVDVDNSEQLIRKITNFEFEISSVTLTDMLSVIVKNMNK